MVMLTQRYVPNLLVRFLRPRSCSLWNGDANAQHGETRIAGACRALFRKRRGPLKPSPVASPARPSSSTSAREYRGRAAIAAWRAASIAKYSFTTEPLSLSAEGDVFTVTAKVTGTFPGSPVKLRFRFTVGDGLIAQLEIAP